MDYISKKGNFAIRLTKLKTDRVLELYFFHYLVLFLEFDPDLSTFRPLPIFQKFNSEDDKIVVYRCIWLVFGCGIWKKRKQKA